MINTQHFVGLSEKFWEDINWFESLSRSTQTFPPYEHKPRLRAITEHTCC